MAYGRDAWQRGLVLVVALACAGRAWGQGDGLPPVSDLLGPSDRLSGGLAVRVERYDFAGHTVFTTEQLRETVAPYTGDAVTTEMLEAARMAVTQRYINAGYINSGAVIPDQTVSDAVVVMQITEGTLTQVVVQGNRHLASARVEGRVRSGLGEPLNINALRDQLEIFRQDPLIERFKAELSPGGEPGQSVLDLHVTENSPWQAGLLYNNHNPPSTGAEKLSVLASHASVTGVGDALGLVYGVTQGGWDDPQLAGLDDIYVDYTRPLNDHGLSVSLGYARSSTLTVEDTFADLDIESESQDGWLTLRQSVWRTPSTEFALAVRTDIRDNQTTLGGEPFSFEPGAEDGYTQLTVLRFIQEFVHRTPRDAFAARSTFSVGLPLFGATQNDDAPDGEFFAWLGQVQYVHRLFDTSNQFVVRGAAQLADDSLLALEQIAVGGVNSVRGYRENQIVRDQALLGTIEFRLPLILDVNEREQLTLVPFADLGHGYNASSPRDSQTLPSVGVGLVFTPNRHVNMELFWGYAFKDFDTPEDTLQDAGIHFSITLLAF